MGYTELYNFLIPLYGLSLGMSAGAIGMLVGGRSLLAVFLAIHVGVLMDRFGTRRVTLFFVWTAMALAPVFPLLSWFWPLLLLPVVELELVAQHIKERGIRRDLDGARLPVQFKGDALCHLGPLLDIGKSRSVG
jgi:MFS-type transporter involved in bile tolerance (Atg22 family)